MTPLHVHYFNQIAAARISLATLILACVTYQLLHADGKRTLSSAMDKFSCRGIPLGILWSLLTTAFTSVRVRKSRSRTPTPT